MASAAETHQALVNILKYFKLNINIYSFFSIKKNSGSFLYQFNTLGTFYYFSGYVDENQKISFRGVVEVVAEQDNELAVDVSVNDIKGKHFQYLF